MDYAKRLNGLPSSISRIHIGLGDHDLAGHLVRTLVDRKEKTGLYTVRWNGQGNLGKDVTSGRFLFF